MAIVSFYNKYALAMILFTMIPLLEITYGCSSQINNNKNLKSLHFTLFQHETMNKTGYILVKGVKGTKGLTQNETPFGTLFVYHDNLTSTSSKYSKPVGFVEGTSVATSFDGLQSMSVAKLTLNVKNHKGSISIVGVTHSIKKSDHPVVGGTEDFVLVQGYVRSSPVRTRDHYSVVMKFEFHLYWPPYANGDETQAR